VTEKLMMEAQEKEVKYELGTVKVEPGSEPQIRPSHDRRLSPVKKRRKVKEEGQTGGEGHIGHEGVPASIPVITRKYIGKFWTEAPLRSLQHYMLLEDFAKFFTDDLLREYLLPLLSPAEGGTGEISRRVMDWFVVNYSKKYPVMYRWEVKPGWTEEVNVCRNYDMYMKKHQKHSLDVFCRGKQRVFFQLDGKIMQTAVAQLNFVRWAIQYGVFHQLRQRYAEVKQDHHENMAKSRQMRKEALLSGHHRKRSSLSIAAPVQSVLRDEPLCVRYV
jgi:hypothetical protein